MNYTYSVRRSRSAARPSGFTLIELMVVVAIIGILVAIALPSYRSYILRGNRAVARAGLLNAQLFMERFYATNNSFARTVGASTDDVALPPGLINVPADSPKYTIAISTTPAVTSNTYQLEARPVSPDSQCANLTLKHTGEKGTTGTGTVADCWK